MKLEFHHIGVVVGRQGAPLNLSLFNEERLAVLWCVCVCLLCSLLVVFCGLLFCCLLFVVGKQNFATEATVIAAGGRGLHQANSERFQNTPENKPRCVSPLG